MILHAVEAGHGNPLVLLHGLFGSARNFGTVQRTFAQRYRTIALDLRNHGASPHDNDMRYAAMAADVLQTLDRISALPATLLGHSMGGKVAMHAALTQPEQVARLIVADIAPVPYTPRNHITAAAMASLKLSPGMTRAQADAALAEAVPDPAVRSFVLQNLQVGSSPAWRIGIAEIAAALPDVEGWDAPAETLYSGPTLFIVGASSDYVQPEHRPAIRALFPNARFVTLKNAGHWLHADNPSGFIAVIEVFLTATA
ncbi:MAG TPA: alpha/beta fold hydrolase [Acetobacteraceae bacterium]|nr:alpha/beta fold hydrolase [Acetobacteraceae bacterium]